MTTTELMRALLDSAYCDGDKFIAEELRLSTGFTGKRGEQRIDLWTMEMVPSKKHWRVAYELKVSRADWLKEKKDPLKRRGARLLSNQFYYVTPPGLITPDEIPIDCGLLEHQEPGRLGHRMRVVVDAPKFDAEPPPWGFVASMMRSGVRSAVRGEQVERRIQERIRTTLELIEAHALMVSAASGNDQSKLDRVIEEIRRTAKNLS